MYKFVFVFFFSLLYVNGFAQTNKYRLFDYYEGYIIQKDGTEKRGYIQYLDESDRYKKVIFRPTKKGKKEKYNPKNLKGYKVADVTYHAVQYEDVILKGLKFLALEKDGCIKRYTFRQYSVEDKAWETTMVLVTKDRAVSTQTFLLKFAEKMAELVKDQPELAQKVKNKEKGYRLLAIENIIDEYNKNCKE